MTKRTFHFAAIARQRLHKQFEKEMRERVRAALVAEKLAPISIMLPEDYEEIKEFQKLRFKASIPLREQRPNYIILDDRA